MKPAERRKYPRFKLSVEVRWKLAGGSESAPQTPSPAQVGKTRNVSAGGASLIVNEQVSIGNILELDIRLSDGNNIRAKGKVLWIDKDVKLCISDTEMGFEAGIEFLDLKDKDRKNINQAIFNAFHK